MSDFDPTKNPAEQLAKAVGGKIDWMAGLPDGSGAATMSMPLPKDHWLTADQQGFNIPPMPFRTGTSESITVNGRIFSRQEFSDEIRKAAKYAIRATTGNGLIEDFDPDAMLSNFVNGMIGYHTSNGLSSDPDANPKT